jgi:hypothetical protein
MNWRRRVERFENSWAIPTLLWIIVGVLITLMVVSQ